MQGRVFLAPHLVAANIGAVEKKGELFANLEFCKLPTRGPAPCATRCTERARGKPLMSLGCLLPRRVPGVMNGDEASGGKRRLEVLLSEEGGAVVQNPTPATFCIIADERACL